MSSNQNQKQKQVKVKGAAATHTGGMRSEAKKARVVFKNVLDTPFNIPWPEVTSENNAIVLDVLCDLVKPIREYHNIKPSKDSLTSSKIKKTKKPSKNDSQSKPNPALATTDYDPTVPAATSQSTPSSETTEAKSTSTPPPAIVNSIIIGINAVTKSLERSIQSLASHPPPSAVLLCKGDLSPTHLYNHLGPMIAMLPGVKLFPLLRGSEKKLSEALGMPAVGALAIKAGGGGAKDAEDLIMILDRMVEPINVPWLPKLKPLTTTTPTVDSKGAAEKKKEVTQAESESKESALASTTPVATETTAVSTSTATPEKSSPASGNTIESKKWIPTNIKSIKSTWQAKPTTSASNNQNNNISGASNTNNNKNKNSGDKGKTQQQQQLNQGKGKKHPSDNPNQERNKDKKAKTS
ncbi:hypothetical protein BGX27_001686 [Mortierella sp. AM989]|nr:hypothetical protein BGX27_001686 [Mortierella sp. AM989]